MQSVSLTSVVKLCIIKTLETIVWPRYSKLARLSDSQSNEAIEKPFSDRFFLRMEENSLYEWLQLITASIFELYIQELLEKL